MTSSYKGIPVSKAGERFGLSLEDLDELFQMREAGEAPGFGDDFGLPLTQAQFTEKGRGGVLGYKAPRTPTITKTLGSAERNAVNISNIFSPTSNISSPTGSAGAPAPKEEIKEPLKKEPLKPEFSPVRSFISPEGGDPTKNILGLSGVQRALQSGMTQQDLMAQAEKEGVGFGPDAAKMLGVSPAKQFLSQYIGSGGTSGTLGLSAVQQARQAGLSDPEIKTFATAQNLNFGPEAQRNLGLASAPAPAPAPAQSAPSVNLSSFIGAGGTAGALGLNAVNQARAQGLSDSQIRQMAAQQGLSLGSAAVASLR
jgi:hypothetical protein